MMIFTSFIGAKGSMECQELSFQTEVFSDSVPTLSTCYSNLEDSPFLIDISLIKFRIMEMLSNMMKSSYSVMMLYSIALNNIYNLLNKGA